MTKNPKVAVGMRFGRLRVVAAGPLRKGHYYWECVCDCGGVITTSYSNLTRGQTSSCGCLQKERASATHRIHGMTGTPTHNTWSSMIQRCINPNLKEFKYWGGRGIKVCERWQVFENFLADVGERPAGKTLDRYPDKNGHYEPGNVRWATPAEQSQNCRPRGPRVPLLSTIQRYEPRR